MAEFADPDGNPGGIDNGIQAGCLINRAVQQQGGGAILIEDAWVQGDYAARRNTLRRLRRPIGLA